MPFPSFYRSRRTASSSVYKIRPEPTSWHTLPGVIALTREHQCGAVPDDRSLQRSHCDPSCDGRGAKDVPHVYDAHEALDAAAASGNCERALDDMNVDEFARILRTLEPHLPISDAYESECPQLQGSWWSSQQEHMLGWFGQQNSRGTGAFTRATPNTSARTTYNRLLATAAFIWMAEALGEDADRVQAAADAARAEPNARKRPGLMRRYLPWNRIAELACSAR